MRHQRKRKILLVDDEKDLIDVLAPRLAVLGNMEVETASDGEEGLSKVAAFGPDAILLDISMPRIDGWEFCRRLKADAVYRDIPVVILTAWASDPLAQHARELGVSKIILKPFDDKAVVDALTSIA